MDQPQEAQRRRAVTRRAGVTRPLWLRLVSEAVVILALWFLYSAGRALAARHTGAAFQNSADVWRVERWLHLPSEAGLQDVFLQWPDLIRAANTYYASVHFPGTIACLVWLFVWRPHYYTWLRRVLVGLTAAALIGHFLYPLAPPRMMTWLGFVDTGKLYNQSVYDAPGHDAVANQYAAMPSLHVAWAVLVALAVVLATRNRWRWIIVVHPVITVFVVVVTANHYWLDGIIGVTLLAVSLAVTPQPAEVRLSWVPVEVEPASEQAPVPA